MNKQYMYELIGRMQAYWDALSCQQKVDIYFEAHGVDLRTEFWRIPECPEYRYDIMCQDGEDVKK